MKYYAADSGLMAAKGFGSGPIAIRKTKSSMLRLSLVCRSTIVYLASVLVFVFSPACNHGSKLVVVIPRSCGTVLWEPEHAGAAHLARKNGVELYWNAPPREDDVEGQ